MKTKPNHPGSITIARWVGSSEGVSIEIKDSASGDAIVTFNMTIKDFGYAISGLGCVKGTIDRFCPENFGMIREVDTVQIPRVRNQDSEEDIESAVRPFETDGWRVRRSDVSNSNRFSKDGKFVNAVRVRYVKANYNDA